MTPRERTPLDQLKNTSEYVDEKETSSYHGLLNHRETNHESCTHLRIMHRKHRMRR